MDQCSICGQCFVNDEDLSFHECFVFRNINKIQKLNYTNFV